MFETDQKHTSIISVLHPTVKGRIAHAYVITTILKGSAMAVQAPEFDSASRTAAKGFAPAEPLRAPGYNTAPPVGSTRLLQALHSLNVGQALSPDIEKYIESIKASFPKDPSTSAVGPIRVERLSEPNGAHVFIAGGAYIVLLFDAVLGRDTQNLLPSSDHGRRAFDALQAQYGKDAKPLHVIVVQPEDYSRTQQMAAYLLLTFAIATSNLGDANISLLSDTVFSIDPSPEVARAFIEQHNPHAVQPHVIIGFTIYAKQPRRNGAQFALEESIPIAAVGAVVDISAPDPQSPFVQSGPVKYSGVVHITNITALIPLPGIVPMCLALAADQFIQQGRWLDPFRSFQKGKPNLGQLSTDPKDPTKLWFANTPKELYDWMSVHMYLRPMLAVDVVEGQARIPSIAVYGDAALAEAAYNQITAFFGPLPLNRSIPPFNIWAEVFNGQYGDSRPGGKLADSREIDYIDLLSKGSQDPSAQRLLYYTQNPAVRARVVYDQSNGTFRSLYRTRISAIHPAVLVAIAGDIVKKLRIDGPARSDQLAPTEWLGSLMDAYQGSNFTAVAAAQGGYNFGGGPTYNFGV
jgi:hypothetical protein